MRKPHESWNHERCLGKPCSTPNQSAKVESDHPLAVQRDYEPIAVEVGL
jgi:hypothetical protein